MNNKELDRMLERIADEIREEPLDEDLVSEARDRVWIHLANEANVPAMHTGRASDAGAPINGCADFQSIIPAYLAGRLSEARALLLLDHTHECVPCRRALKNGREGKFGIAEERRPRLGAPAKRALSGSVSNLRPVILRWGIAAALVIGVGLIAWPIVQRYLPVGSFEATVQAADGPMYLVADSQTHPLKAGDKINRGDVVRTAKDAHALVRLDDGTTIEMKDRSEFSISNTLRGTTIHLGNGSVIVEAAKQKGGMFVDTGDSLVSVTGTTFAVNAGTKGSRVSVIKGEVHLDRGGEDKVIRAGEQATTNAAIEPIPVKEEVSWSRNAARYSQLLDGLAGLRRDLNALPKPGVRYSTHLLDMMPANTVFYAALPNLGAAIAESNRIIEERIQQNPALRDWFQSRPQARGPGMDQAVSTLKEFGDQLGDEIAIGAGMNDQGQPTGPIVLAQLKNPADFHAFVDGEIQKLAAGGKGPQVQWIDDPKNAQPTNAAADRQLYLWIDGDTLVASPKLEGVQAIAQGANSFSSTPFYSRVAQVYQEGAGVVLGADLETIIAHTRGLRRLAVGDASEQALNQLGVFNMKSFVLNSKDAEGKTHTRATLFYDHADHGITSWLAQPGPMGSLDYISPDANLVAGFVIKNPTAVVDDLLAVLSNVCPDLQKHLDQLQNDHGLNLRNDFAGPLGGEYAFSIDGPILPTPSWKLVLQVNDPAHLEQTVEQVIAEINKQAAREGKQGLDLEKSDSGGRTFYTIHAKDFGALEVNYVFANGYLLLGPTRALLDQALRFHDSGTTLVRSAKFTAGLPADGNVNFSALVYQNLAPLVQPFADRIAASGNQGKQPAIAAMAVTMQPTLAYAYAYGDHIEFAANTDGGPFGLSPASVLGMPNAFELHRIIEQTVQNPASQK